ncbi:MAG: glycosyltransferase family 1 protein, partial [Streptococcus sp.]|nr:glycosyltransferase family 1 protein [Streptococcus sp.]
MKTKILQMGADNFGAGGRSVIAYNLTRPLTDAFQVDFLAIGKLKNPSFHRIIEENGGYVQHVKEASSKIKRLRSIYSILKNEKYDIVHINVDDAIEGLFNIILSKISGAKIVLHAH